MDFLERNIFTKLRADYFHSQEEMEPMTSFKKKQLEQLMTNISDFTNDEVVLSNHFLNYRFQKIVNNEHHAIDTSTETLEILYIIIRNVNGMLNRGIPLLGVISLGKFLRTKGDKVDFIKLDKWLSKLHLRRMAQLQGSILIEFFKFEPDELPFVTHLESATQKLTLHALHLSVKDTIEEWHFRQTHTGFVRNNGKILRRNLRQGLRYFNYAPIETTSNFILHFIRSLSEIEE